MLARRPPAGSVRAATLALLAGAFPIAACGTIDPGPPTGPPMGCNGSPTFFVARVWPEYLEKYQCGQADCHDSLSGHGYFRLKPPGPAPMAGDPPSAWPEEWRFNYVNASRLLNCGDPTGSLLVAVPGGKAQPHAGGVLFTGQEATDAEKLFIEWSTAP